MDRYLLITRQANDDGTETIYRSLMTLDAVIDHCTARWPHAMRDYVTNPDCLRTLLRSRGVGDFYDGPDYWASGRTCVDRVVALHDVEALAEAANESCCVAVHRSGRAKTYRV